LQVGASGLASLQGIHLPASLAHTLSLTVLQLCLAITVVVCLWYGQADFPAVHHFNIGCALLVQQAYRLGTACDVKGMLADNMLVCLFLWLISAFTRFLH
jgi:chromosome condensin MukBEF complex kleisin-like MukF subunit